MKLLSVILIFSLLTTTASASPLDQIQSGISDIINLIKSKLGLATLWTPTDQYFVTDTRVIFFIGVTGSPWTVTLEKETGEIVGTISGSVGGRYAFQRPSPGNYYLKVSCSFSSSCPQKDLIVVKQLGTMISPPPKISAVTSCSSYFGAPICSETMVDPVEVVLKGDSGHGQLVVSTSGIPCGNCLPWAEPDIGVWTEPTSSGTPTPTSQPTSQPTYTVQPTSTNPPPVVTIPISDYQCPEGYTQEGNICVPPPRNTIPAFESIYAVIGILITSYLIVRQKKENT